MPDAIGRPLRPCHSRSSGSPQRIIGYNAYEKNKIIVPLRFESFAQLNKKTILSFDCVAIDFCPCEREIVGRVTLRGEANIAGSGDPAYIAVPPLDNYDTASKRRVL